MRVNQRLTAIYVCRRAIYLQQLIADYENRPKWGVETPKTTT